MARPGCIKTRFPTAPPSPFRPIFKHAISFSPMSLGLSSRPNSPRSSPLWFRLAPACIHCGLARNLASFTMITCKPRNWAQIAGRRRLALGRSCGAPASSFRQAPVQNMYKPPQQQQQHQQKTIQDNSERQFQVDTAKVMGENIKVVIEFISSLCNSIDSSQY